jgi:hypothetical protein
MYDNSIFAMNWFFIVQQTCFVLLQTYSDSEIKLKWGFQNQSLKCCEQGLKKFVSPPFLLSPFFIFSSSLCPGFLPTFLFSFVLSFLLSSFLLLYIVSFLFPSFIPSFFSFFASIFLSSLSPSCLYFSLTSLFCLFLLSLHSFTTGRKDEGFSAFQLHPLSYVIFHLYRHQKWLV